MNFEFSAINQKQNFYKDTSSNKFLQKLQKTAVFTKNSGFGRSAETRTLDLLLPNNVKRFFLVIYRAFSCFSVGFRYSLGLFRTAFHR